MNADTILANPDIIQLESFISEPNAITIVVSSKQLRPCCPNCDHPSESLHSRYRRMVADLPWHNVAVKLQLNTRKFRCRNGQSLAEDFLREIARSSPDLRSKDEPT